MPDRRLELHEKLCDILGTRNVYFQPPEDIKIKYPAIVYGLSDIKSLYANGGVYLFGKKYEIIIIDKDPDSLLTDKVASLPTSHFVRPYQADNLNHWVFELFY